MNYKECAKKNKSIEKTDSGITLSYKCFSAVLYDLQRSLDEGIRGWNKLYNQREIEIKVLIWLLIGSSLLNILTIIALIMK